MLFATPDVGEAEQRVLGEVESLRDTLKLYLRDTRRWHGSLRRLAFARAIRGVQQHRRGTRLRSMTPPRSHSVKNHSTPTKRRGLRWGDIATP